MSEIQYYKRSVYGRTECVPTGEHAKDVTDLTGRKTISPTIAAALVGLGHDLVQVPMPNDPLAPAPVPISENVQV